MVVAHRRSGKTTATLNHLIRDAIRTESSKWAYISPTYKQSKNIAWDILKEHAGKVDGVKFNESELRCDFKNGSRITLYGADNPDSLRGLGLWGVVFDEYSQQPSNIFTEIIRPALADHNGYAIWIGTPKGRNEFYRLYELAKNSEDWLAILKTADDTKLISDQELKSSRQVMTPDEYAQEWYCSFDASIRGAYYAEELDSARKEKRIRLIPYEKGLPVYTVWDLGIGDATAIGFYQRTSTEIRMIDYYESSEKGLTHYIQMVQQRGYVYGKHFAPHDIKVRELTTGMSRIETAKGLGINFEVVPSIPIDDGIHAGRLVFNKTWIDEDKCRTFLDYLAQYHKEWNDKKGMFEEKPYHDFTSHAADVHRYMAVVEKEMTNEETKPFKQEPYQGRDQYDWSWGDNNNSPIDFKDFKKT